MEEIAKGAEFTKRTVYQYFGSKEDLYFAVVIKGFRALLAHMEATEEGPGDGFSRIRRSFHRLYGFYRDNPEVLRLISQWSTVRNRGLDGKPSMEDLQALNRPLFGQMAIALRQGMADGSVRAGLAVEPTVYSLVFLATGFLAQLASTGESFTKQFGLDPEAFAHSSFDLILNGIAAGRDKS